MEPRFTISPAEQLAHLREVIEAILVAQTWTQLLPAAQVDSLIKFLDWSGPFLNQLETQERAERAREVEIFAALAKAGEIDGD